MSCYSVDERPAEQAADEEDFFSPPLRLLGAEGDIGTFSMRTCGGLIE